MFSDHLNKSVTFCNKSQKATVLYFVFLEGDIVYVELYVRSFDDWWFQGFCKVNFETAWLSQVLEDTKGDMSCWWAVEICVKYTLMAVP